MPNSKLSYQALEVTLDLIPRLNVNIRGNRVSHPIPGGYPVKRPLGTGGKIVAFDITLDADTYAELRTKKKALEDFVESHQNVPVTITCNPDPDYSGTYLVELSGALDAKDGFLARYTLTAEKVYP